mgnify:CR=1 FL=1
MLNNEAVCACKEFYQGETCDTETRETYVGIYSGSPVTTIEGIDYTAFFNDSRNRLRIKRSELSYHFLSICRPYWEMPKVIKEYSHDKLEIKRAIVHKNKKLIKKLKEIMGDDFV